MQTGLTENYQPAYIIGQDPLRFGGQQQDYLLRSRQVIQATAEKIIQARKSGRNLRELFFELLADLSKQRTTIARDHHTKEAEDFGIRRDAYKPACISILLLVNPYKKYGDKILELFSKYLEKMQVPNSQFQKELVIEEEYQGRKSKLVVEVWNQQDLQEKGLALQPFSYYPPYISHKTIEALNSENKWTSDQIIDYRNRFLQFKKETPENYRKWRTCGAISQLFQKCPSPLALGLRPEEIWSKYSQEDARQIFGNMKSLYVHVLLRTEVNKKLYTITEYFTWMYENEEWVKKKDPDHHPIKRMKERSKILMLHQDEFLIQDTLEEAAKVFEEAVLWNQKNQPLDQLIDSMALLLHLLIHNIRDIRGTAAENEWLEQAIYQSIEEVDFSIDRREQMIDLEGFAHPLFSEFREVYRGIVKLKIKSS
jgi:hypothetical protein